jgi:hypothetical protein
MKYRADFVTNSSSSSFVIAVRKDIEEDELEKLLIPAIVKQTGFTLEEEDTYINDYIKSVKKLLFKTKSKNNMDLGDWCVYTALELHDCDELYMAYVILCSIKSEYVKGIQS